MLIPTIFLAILLLTKKSTLEKHFSKEALQKLNIKNNHFSNKKRTVILFLTIILMIFSLARPVIEEKEQEFKQETISYIIAIDVSKSMLANDLKPNRLMFAKQKAYQLIQNSKDKAVGVILFSNSSYILSPLTQDFISLSTLIENLDLGLNFDNGSSIISALKTSSKLLNNSTSKNIILLTDGSDKIDFSKEIEFAEDNELKIYTITTAKEKTPIRLKDGSFLTSKEGSIVTVGLNEQIKNLSLQTKAAYINYTLNQKDINSVLNEITRSSTKDNIASRKFRTYTELFYYPLILSLILLLIAFSSLPKIRKTIPLFLICFLNYDGQAGVMDFQTIDKATKSYKNKNFTEATKEFQKLDKSIERDYNLANSLYKEKKYKQALTEYKKIVTSKKNLEYKKLHNLGNTYTKLNDLENASKMYKKALELEDNKQTKENLKMVQEALKKKKQQKNKKSGKKNKKQKEKKDTKNKQKQKDKSKKDEKQKQDENSNESSNKAKKDKKTNKQNKKKGSLNKQNKRQEISDLEEKKWLNQLNNQKMKVLLKKDEEEKENNENLQLW